MSFLRKKRIKFAVELVVDKLTDVSLLNATLFAKVRLLDCGSFEACTESRELRNHVCQLYAGLADPDKAFAPPPAEPPSPDSEDTENRPAAADDAPQPDNRQQPFRFQCRIPYNDQTGELEECRCKVSIRKMERAGRPPTKLGFVIVNLTEFAASGSTPIEQSYLLDGYTGRQRQDNSRVHLAVRMMHQMSDPLFKVPSNALHPVEPHTQFLNPADRKAPSTTSRHADVAEEVRRRLEQPALDAGGALLDEAAENRPGSTQPPASVPHSSTHSSFGSATSAEPQPPQHQQQPSPPPALSTPNRFSHQPMTDRRPSMPTTAADRASWHAGASEGRPSMQNNGLLSADQQQQLLQQPQPQQLQQQQQQLLDMRRNCTTRRMSDDRMVASAHVPNRVQQTRRDADSVIEEVLAEAAACAQPDEEEEEDKSAEATTAAAGLPDPRPEPGSTSDEEEAAARLATPRHRAKRGLALFVSRRNGDFVLGSGAGQAPAPSFERVQLDSSIGG